MKYTLKPKPLWIRAFTKPYQWVTLGSTIYHPTYEIPSRWPTIVEHEKVHVAQQARDGVARFLWRYLTDREARLAYEAEAIAEEYLHTAPQARLGVLDWYAQALAGPPYRRAARSALAALEVLTNAIAERSRK